MHSFGNLFVRCGKVSQSVSESHVVVVSSDFLAKLALWIRHAQSGTQERLLSGRRTDDGNELSASLAKDLTYLSVWRDNFRAEWGDRPWGEASEKEAKPRLVGRHFPKPICHRAHTIRSRVGREEAKTSANAIKKLRWQSAINTAGQRTGKLHFPNVTARTNKANDLGRPLIDVEQTFKEG